ncbi:MAG TPA: hypothetical protein VFS11_05355, partial [Gemmatimonadales bacterium]|nr:hypothetical protein [Gemmatimonadales bacterium]
MKRIGLVSLGLALGLVSTANAQLTMQMSNGWTFTFAGNVNTFAYYEKSSTSGSTPAAVAVGGIAPAGGVVNTTRLTVGLLPAFAVFDAKGKEGNTDLGVHFGFAPNVQCGTGINDCFGAQIDMRQVYLTVGGAWGQLLVGRELGLFSRQNILTDQTLFGIGATGNGTPGDGVGTTLGRIGFGYIYPNFRAQITYSTAAGKPAQFSIGIFEAAAVNNAPSSSVGGVTPPGPYTNTRYPRVEAELTYNAGGAKVWAGGVLQNVKTAPTGTTSSLTSWGGDGGFRYEKPTFSVTGSGYYGKGLGTTLFGLNGACSIGTAPCTTSSSDGARKSYGFIGQLTVTPPNSKVTIAGSYGSSYLRASNVEQAIAATDFKTENTLVSGGIYYQATKSLKVVGEFDYWWTKGKLGGAQVGSTN